MFFCERNPDFIWKTEDLVAVESEINQEEKYNIIIFNQKCELECLRVFFDAEIEDEIIGQLTIEFLQAGEWKRVDKKAFLGDKKGEVIIPLNEEYQTDSFRILLINNFKILNMEGFKRKYPGLFLEISPAGFGDRMIAFLNAMYLAKQIGFKFGFRWPFVNKEKIYGKNPPKELIEIIDAGLENEVFSEEFIQKYAYTARKIAYATDGTPKVRYVQDFLKKPYRFSYGYLARHNNLKLHIEEFPLNFKKEYASLWKTIGFSKAIKNILNEATKTYLDKFSNKETLALHIRSGDIVYSPGRMRDFYFFQDKATPIEIALEMIEQNPLSDIVLFSDVKAILRRIVAYYKEKNRNNLYDSTEFIPEGLNNAQRALFEVQFMSHFTKIYSPSGFARLASLLSRAEEPLMWANIFTDEQKYSILKKNFDKVVVHPLQSAFSLFCLFMFAKKIGKPTSELKEILTKAKELDGENSLYYVFLVYCLILDGDYQEANKYIQDNMRVFMEKLVISRWKHELRNIASNHDKKIMHNFPYVSYFLATINEAIGNKDASMEYYALAFSGDTSNPIFAEECKKENLTKYIEIIQSSFAPLQTQLQQKDQIIQTKNQELESRSKEIQSLKQSLDSLPIKKQTLEIKNLEQDNLLKQIQIQEAKQDLINKQLHTKKLEKELGYESNVLKELELNKQELIQTKNQLDSTKKQLESKTKELESKNKILSSNPNTSHLIQNASCFKGKLAYLNTLTTAKDRIHNHLSYKLGQAMIENSKSLLGYIRMPYVLSYIKDKHKQEQQQYQEAIKKNPNLKLPNLESYPDYKESLKEKECFTYKLGEALMKADKTWYKGGYVKLWFEAKRLEREYREKRGG